jgi:hypothetical protein
MRDHVRHGASRRESEDAFFIKQDRRLVDRLRALNELGETKEAISRHLGIRDDRVLQRLVDLGVRPGTVASLAAIPLAEVAWADGRVDARERSAVLAAAASAGIAPGTIERELLEAWLVHRPEARILEAWRQYIRGLCAQLSDEERLTLRREVLERARTVASASGGLLGLASISRREEAVLRALDAAFDPGAVRPDPPR